MEESERHGKEVGEVEIWSWGAGTDGQLGTTKVEDEHLPQLLDLPRFSSAGPISLLACGGAHVLALTTDGKVATWGRGTSGQLGHGDMFSSLQPKHVKLLESFVITHVSAGWGHSGFVSETGCLFTCGDGSFGQLGHGDCKSYCSPVKVSYFDSKHVNQIACGMRHSLVLLKGIDIIGSFNFLHGSMNNVNQIPLLMEVTDCKIIAVQPETAQSKMTWKRILLVGPANPATQSFNLKQELSFFT